MTDINMVVFGVLWVLTAALASLLLVLYRRIDVAYKSGEQPRFTGLVPGTRLPPIEILNESGLDWMPIPQTQRHILAFVNASCDDCHRLLRNLEGDSWNLPVIAVITSGDRLDESIYNNPRFSVYVAGHAPDLKRDYGVNVVPVMYVIAEGRVASGRVAVSKKDIESVISQARLEYQEKAVPRGI